MKLSFPFFLVNCLSRSLLELHYLKCFFLCITRKQIQYRKPNTSSHPYHKSIIHIEGVGFKADYEDVSFAVLRSA